jgi:hypothetical protein
MDSSCRRTRRGRRSKKTMIGQDWFDQFSLEYRQVFPFLSFAFPASDWSVESTRGATFIPHSHHSYPLTTYVHAIPRSTNHYRVSWPRRDAERPPSTNQKAWRTARRSITKPQVDLFSLGAYSTNTTLSLTEKEICKRE